MKVSTQSQKRIGTLTALVALLAAAVLVNLLQLNLVSSKGRFKPLPRYHTADITKIAEKLSADLKERYAFFFELGRRYPRSTIILRRSAEPVGPLVARFLSYGRARSVLLANYEPEAIISGLEYQTSIVARGKIATGWKLGREAIPFVIAAGSNPDVFLVLQQQDKMVLLDLALLLEARSTPHD